MYRSSGVTIPEMLIALTIAAAMTSLALPAFQGFAQQNRAAAALNQLLGALQSARHAAITLRTAVTLCPSAVDTECGARDTWHRGTLMFADRNGNGRRDANEQVLRWLPGFDDRSRIYWRSFRNRSYLHIKPSGMTDWQNGNLLYCPPDGNPRYAREVIINAQARPRTAPDTDHDGIAEDADGLPLRCP
jgi:type IV fimbrial biogenesis protein FimT